MAHASFSGYTNNYGMITQPRTDGLVETYDVYRYSFFSEINSQIKENILSNGNFKSDLSFIGKVYRNDDKYTHNFTVKNNYFLHINELFFNYKIKNLSLFSGKMKLNMGTGVNYSPSNILNSQKNLVDYQTPIEGILLAESKLNLGTSSTLTFGFSPDAKFGDHNLYTSVMHFQDSNQTTPSNHYAFFLQYYQMLWNSDIFLTLYNTNRYQNQFEDKYRFSLNFSRYFFDLYEFHLDSIFQKGHDRATVNSTCVQNYYTFQQCIALNQYLSNYNNLNDNEIYYDALIGSRYQFSNDSFINFEYLYQKDGYDKKGFQDLVNLYYNGLKLNRISGVSLPKSISTSSFSLLRKNYIFASYQNYKLLDDFIINLYYMQNIDDTSYSIIPNITWSIDDNLQILTYVFYSHYFDKNKLAYVSDNRSCYSEQDFFDKSFYFQLGFKYLF